MQEMIALPWLPDAVRVFLDAHALPEARVFEWGCGGSTLYFADRGCTLVTVEHDQMWLDRCSTAVQRSNVTLLYRPPDDSDIRDKRLSDPLAYRSKCVPGSFEMYATAIEDYGLFDVILVDGRARASCLYHAKSHVADGGILVLDNTDRPYYLAETGYLYAAWDRVSVDGHGPRLPYKWQALCWWRRDGN